MLFNSFAFFVFAPIVLAAYFALHGRSRLLLLLSASYFFYGWWDWRFTGLLLISTIVDYTVGLMMGGTEDPRRRHALMLVSLCSNLGILGTFKYFDFFSQSFGKLMDSLGWPVSSPIIDVILPVGISFYTFQTLSYTIDIYRKRITPERDFLRFAAYVSLFPQLVAGPIVRAADLLPQLAVDHRYDVSRIGRGLEMIAWGFFLKLCLADTAAIVVNSHFSSPQLFGSLSHIVGVLSFSAQIYGDFAGYSLIAIGLGRIMGFDFGINFNRPYFARSFSEFWGRWHISLSSWLRDYLYIPLGGNRNGTYRTFRNLFLTMGLGGLWHGAGMNFIVWGLLHGTYLVGQRILATPFWTTINRLSIPKLLANLFLVFLVFFLTNLAWVFFRADNFDQAMEIIQIIGTLEDFSLRADTAKSAIIKTFFIAAIVIAVDSLTLINRIRSTYMSNTLLRCLGMASLVWAIALLGTFQGASFIYFQF